MVRQAQADAGERADLLTGGRGDRSWSPAIPEEAPEVERDEHRAREDEPAAALEGLERQGAGRPAHELCDSWVRTSNARAGLTRKETDTVSALGTARRTIPSPVFEMQPEDAVQYGE